MEIKKSPKANLENKKLFYREIGLIIALGVVLMAFEWSTEDKAENFIQEETKAVVEVEQIPVTTEAPPPPPSQPKIPVLSDRIDIVDDEIKVDTDLFISLEDNDDMGIEIMDYVTEVYEEEIEEAPIPYSAMKEKPTFLGGDPMSEFPKWVMKNMTYPEVARENGISGRVYIEFVVEKDGRVSNVRVLRGVDASLDKEAVRVVSSSPKWSPGKQRDKAVRFKFQVPVIFQLRN